MKPLIYTRPLDEGELLAHLRAREEIIFRLPGLRWQEIEHELERLGFGDLYVVSATKGPHGESCKIGLAGAAHWERQNHAIQPTVQRA